MPRMNDRIVVAVALGISAGLFTVTPASAAEQAVAPFAGLWQWVLEGQREMMNAMTAAVRQLKAGDVVASGAVLAIISFIYGVLHAVGPGHGKFVISSYALATERTVRRGILLSFMAAFVQALSAIVIVGVLAVILQVTSTQIRVTETWLESASWGLIALLGAWLIYRQVKPLLGRPVSAQAGAVAQSHAADHHHDHDHDHGHEGCDTCSHAHIAAPSELDRGWSWSKAWMLALSIGIRPCTGAIGVLIFALGLGIFWAGVFATFAMAIGTAITVSVLASLAVGSRELATRIAGGTSRWAGRIQTAAGLVGSVLVFAIGVTFFVASLTNPGPL